MDGGLAITVGGRRYRVQCAPNEVDRLQALARHVDTRAVGISRTQGHIQESMLLLMVCLTLADELDDAKVECARLRDETGQIEERASSRGADVLAQAAERLAGIVGRIEREA